MGCLLNARNISAGRPKKIAMKQIELANWAINQLVNIRIGTGIYFKLNLNEFDK